MDGSACIKRKILLISDKLKKKVVFWKNTTCREIEVDGNIYLRILFFLENTEEILRYVNEIENFLDIYSQR